MLIAMAAAATLFQGCYSHAVQQDPAMLKAVNPQNSNIESASYILRAGDWVRISAQEYPEFDTTAIVAESGAISMRLIGDVKVAGLSREQAEKAIGEQIGMYAKSTKIIVAMTILKGTETKVIMLGAVARQDTFAVTTPVSLLESLAAAGGIQPDADLRRIKIYRRESSGPPLVFDLTNFFETGNLREIPKIGPGDIVYVPREENFIREFSGYLRDTVLLFGLFSIAR
jgi:protein involved in polysaccharide export with SLBB domain